MSFDEYAMEQHDRSNILDHLVCTDTLKPSLKKRYLKALEILLQE